MTQALQAWVRMPNAWIEDGGLVELRWVRGQGAANLAALMALMVLNHHVDHALGVSRLTYDALSDMTGLSRSKLSAGLKVLEAKNLITRRHDGRSGYLLAKYGDPCTWAQLPANGLYRHGVVAAFAEFKLRHAAELEALKLYLLFASRRDRRTNMAHTTYDRIEYLTGIARGNIKRALNVLAANGLVHIEFVDSQFSENGIANAYRLAHLNTRRHMATMGRRDLAALRPTDQADDGPF